MPEPISLLGMLAGDTHSPPVAPSSVSAVVAPLADAFPIPEPCASCGNTIRWLTVSNKWLCIECAPYSHPLQAKKKIFLATEFDDTQKKNISVWFNSITNKKISSVAEFNANAYAFFSQKEPAAKPRTIIEEAFFAKLTPPDGLTFDEWWNTEVSERSREIEEVQAGKWRSYGKTVPIPPATKKAATPSKVPPPVKAAQARSALGF